MALSYKFLEEVPSKLEINVKWACIFQLILFGILSILILSFKNMWRWGGGGGVASWQLFVNSPLTHNQLFSSSKIRRGPKSTWLHAIWIYFIPSTYFLQNRTKWWGTKYCRIFECRLVEIFYPLYFYQFRLDCHLVSIFCQVVWPSWSGLTLCSWVIFCFRFSRVCSRSTGSEWTCSKNIDRIENISIVSYIFVIRFASITCWKS